MSPNLQRMAERAKLPIKVRFWDVPGVECFEVRSTKQRETESASPSRGGTAADCSAPSPGCV
jgi:hypothetical protein